VPLADIARRARRTSYASTWRETGPVGRRFLTGAALYASRLGATILLLPLLANARGYAGGEIGILISAASLPLLVFSLPVTRLARRGWHRHLLALAPLLAGAGLSLVALLPPGQLAATAVAAFLSGLGGAAFWSLGDPILAGTTPPGRRTHVFALKFFIWISGMAVGGVLGGWLPALIGRFGFEPAAAFAGAMLVVVALDLSQAVAFWSLPLPRERPRSKTAGAVAAGAPWLSIFALVVPEIFVAIGFGSVKPYLSLFLVEGQGFSTSATGSVLALAAAAGGAGALALPGIIGRVGSVPALVACRLLGGAVIALWFLGLGAPLLVLLICLYWAVIDGSEGPYVAAALERLPAADRSSFSALYALLWSLGSAGAAFVGGRIQEATSGFAVAFGVGIAGYLVCGAWVGLVFPRLPPLAADPPPPAVDEAVADGDLPVGTTA